MVPARGGRRPVNGSGLPQASAPSKSADGIAAAAATKQESYLVQWAHKLGLGCIANMDVGLMECSLKPVRIDEVERQATMGLPTCAGPSGDWVTHIPCSTTAPEAPVCCVPEEHVHKLEMFAPCVVCAHRPATIVEVPCGHVNVCAECHRDYHTNTRCIRCRGSVPMRLDLAPFLDEVTGRPDECKICKAGFASVVMMPCIHMGFCAGCLPKNVLGCPTCGEKVDGMCTVQWVSSAAAALEAYSHRSATRRSLQQSARSEAGGDKDLGLVRATEDVDEEIARLERQLFKLRAMPAASKAAPSRPTQGGDFIPHMVMSTPAAARPPSARLLPAPDESSMSNNSMTFELG